MAAMSRRMFLLGGVSAFPYLYLERISVEVRRYQVPVQNLPARFRGFTILQLTDLHDKEFGRRGEDLLALLRTLKFDMVALTGDLVVGENPILTPALDLVAGIRAFSGAPVFSVFGNHEYGMDLEKEYQRKLEGAGVRVLFNEAVPIQRGKELIWLAGVDDPVTRRDRIAATLAGTDRGAPRVLLAHAPLPFLKAAQAGVDLLLAGHTHGGQVRLPLLGAAYVPSMGYFPRYDYGLYRAGDTTMIVNGGLGESWVPVRFNIRPEVVLATLVPRGEARPEGG